MVNIYNSMNGKSSLRLHACVCTCDTHTCKQFTPRVNVSGWVMSLAEKNPVIKGVVAGLDLTDPNVSVPSNAVRLLPPNYSACQG